MEEGNLPYSLNVVANNLILFDEVLKDPDDEVTKDKLLVEFKFDDINFDVTTDVNNISDFREGRSIEFEATTEGLRDKLQRKGIEVSIYKGSKRKDGLVGKISSPWPQFVANRFVNHEIGSIPFYKDHQIVKNGQIVGTLELTAQINSRCPEPRTIPPDSPLKIDKTGQLEEYKNIKNNIDNKDIFFVVGSNQSPCWNEPSPREKSNKSLLDEKDDTKCTYHLNTDQFLGVKGKFVPDFRIMKNISCGVNNPLNMSNKTMTELNKGIKCFRISECVAKFGEDKKAEEEKGCSGTSGSDVDSRGNPCEKATRRKCFVHTRGNFKDTHKDLTWKSNFKWRRISSDAHSYTNRCERCRCKRTVLSSESEANEPPKNLPPTLSECYLQEVAAQNKIKLPKNFPEIPTIRCTNCCYDMTYQPANIACPKCGLKPRRMSFAQVSGEEDDIVEEWGENEKTFIKNRGFSKYDHCTCEKTSLLECIFCAINKLRKKEEEPNLNFYVKESAEKSRNHVDDVCREVLNAYAPPVERDSEGNLMKRPPIDVPKLAKMVTWLKRRCSYTSTRTRPISSTMTKCGRLCGGADSKLKPSKNKQSPKQSKDLANRVQKGPKTNNPMNAKYLPRSGPAGAPTKGSNARSLGAFVSPGDGKAKTKKSATSKKMKELINRKFDDTDNFQNDDCDKMKTDWMLDDIHDTELREACKELCDFRPESVWRKTPPPMTKDEYLKKMIRKYGRRYSYLKRSKSVNASVRHRNCHEAEPLVPRKMGWLWNLDSTQAARGWRPGRLKKSIRELMEYFLREFPVDNLPNSNQLCGRKRGYLAPPEDLTPKPTLHVRKRDGKYLITMNPLKDSKSLQTSANPYANAGPIQFQISKSPQEIKRRQVKRCLKEAGFVRCTCGKPISECICRSFMEKQRLDKALYNLETLLDVENLRNIVVLSDTTSSESQLNLEITPPAGMMKPHLVGKRKDSQATQYNPDDLKVFGRKRTAEEVIQDQLRKIKGEECPGIKPVWPCKPIPVVKVRELPPRPVNEPEPSSDTDADLKRKEAKQEIKQKSAMTLKPKKGGKKAPGSKTIPNLTFAKNKGKGGKGLTEQASKGDRIRGGADMPPEGRNLLLTSSHPSPTPLRKSMRRTFSHHHIPVRVTKPMDRWERYKRRRPVRPPWDNTIYLPPPLKCNSPKQGGGRPSSPNLKQTSPHKNQTNNAKYNKNCRNHQMTRYVVKKDKACNTDFEDVEKKAAEAAELNAKKSSYHKNCAKPATPPPKLIKSKLNASR